MALETLVQMGKDALQAPVVLGKAAGNIAIGAVSFTLMIPSTHRLLIDVEWGCVGLPVGAGLAGIVISHAKLEYDFPLHYSFGIIAATNTVSAIYEWYRSAQERAKKTE